MSIKEKIAQANAEAVDHIIKANPVLTDVKLAKDLLTGMDERTITHSGPPIDYKDMCPLHQRSMASGVLFEGWAATESEARAMLERGEVKLISALDTNTVGAGVGVITPSMVLFEVKDMTSGKVCGTYPVEGRFQGGLCGWGVYTPEIGENLRHMRDYLFPALGQAIRNTGGVPLKPIIAEGMQMGDENHTRQVAGDLLFKTRLIPELARLDVPRQQMIDAVDYLITAPRFFHCLGQVFARVALEAASGIDYCTMVTAVAGNGVQFGIKVSATGDRWFTAPAPMMEGRYTSSKYTIADQMPWIGDSCVVECAGMGGIAEAASPIVANLRGLKLRDAIAITREMETISIAKNPNFPIPNLDFDFLPVGIDIRKVLKTGSLPLIHGGMFNREGGLIGAGCARVPQGCFEKALEAFSAQYPNG